MPRRGDGVQQGGGQPAGAGPDLDHPAPGADVAFEQDLAGVLGGDDLRPPLQGLHEIDRAGAEDIELLPDDLHHVPVIFAAEAAAVDDPQAAEFDHGVLEPEEVPPAVLSLEVEVFAFLECHGPPDAAGGYIIDGAGKQGGGPRA